MPTFTLPLALHSRIFVRIEIAYVLCILSQSLWVYMVNLVLSGPLCFLESSYMSDSYNLFTLIQKLSEAWKEGCDVQIPFRAELSTVSYSLVVD